MFNYYWEIYLIVSLKLLARGSEKFQIQWDNCKCVLNYLGYTKGVQRVYCEILHYRRILAKELRLLAIIVISKYSGRIKKFNFLGYTKGVLLIEILFIGES